MTKDWHIRNFLETQGERLTIDGVDAVELAREFGTPVFVYSETRIRHNIERLKKVGERIDRPLKLCYAGKAISTLGILRAVNDAGSDIEVNSGGELWKALNAGFRGGQIVFNGTSKEVWELEMAIKAEIFAIQVDSMYELSLIKETAKRLGKRANVSLRLVPEIGSATHSGLQTAMVTSKFGMMPDEALASIRGHSDSAELNFCGVHLHIGSQNPDPSVYTEALAMLFANLSTIYSETGVRLSHINIGGGFPVNYLRDTSHIDDFPTEQREMFSANFEPADAIGSAWESIKKVAAAAETQHFLEGLTLVLEPGRSIISDAAVCLTTVRNAKQRPVRGSNGIDSWLLTDAGFNILLSMETYKWYYHLISAERAGTPHQTPYKLAGPLCDGGDVYFDIEGYERLPDHRLLPENVEPGEVLALLNCGAYSLSQASQYNGRPLPPVVIIRTNGTPELIRKRETFEDLVLNDI